MPIPNRNAAARPLRRVRPRRGAPEERRLVDQRPRQLEQGRTRVISDEERELLESLGYIAQ